ncbi:sensor histidine kinase [Dactylosporangium sp. CA-233914]|uniref:sensor histidine kinase n=1 Tax=Dactylosporangium sp. CA-233914 TaxID=3239934 RepID=UPI003D920C41
MRALWLLLLVLPVLCGLPFTRAPGLVVSITAMLAVAAAIRPALFALPITAALGSLAVTLIYRGPPQPPGLWLPFEFTPLLVLQARLLRRAPAGRAALAGAMIALAATLLPLRVTLNQPQHRLDGSILLAASAFALTVAAAGLGLFLRAGDTRRARSLAAARRAQRLELARDLHDLVAHEVTGIVVEAQAAQLAPAPDSYARIESAGQRALAAMDDLIAALRATSADDAPARVHGLADLPGVVSRFGSSATLSIAPGVQLPPEAGTAAYHVVIEALTNVRRHAPTGARVTVTLSPTGVLTVTDRADTSDLPISAPRDTVTLPGISEMSEREGETGSGATRNDGGNGTGQRDGGNGGNGTGQRGGGNGTGQGDGESGTGQGDRGRGVGRREQVNGAGQRAPGSDIGQVDRGRVGGGSGLSGLAERVRGVGGSLRAGPVAGGWEVVCDLSRSADVRGGGRQQP